MPKIGASTQCNQETPNGNQAKGGFTLRDVHVAPQPLAHTLRDGMHQERASIFQSKFLSVPPKLSLGLHCTWYVL